MTVQITIGSAIALAVLAFILGSLRDAASSILADEFKASAPAMSQWLVRLAARAIPKAHREDQLETWLAELHELRDRPLAALRYALVNGLIAAPFLARQLQPALLPAPQRADGTARGSDAIRAGTRRFLARITLRLPNREGVGQGLFARLVALPTLVFALILELARRFGSLTSLQPVVTWVRLTERLLAALIEVIEFGLSRLIRLAGFVGGLPDPYGHSRGGWWSVVQLFKRIAVVVAGFVTLTAVGIPVLRMLGF